MSATANQNESGSRWWEFYAVRYGMGTVVGAVIVFLLCKLNPSLTPMLFQAGKATDPSIDGATLALLAGYGLAYCYLASAPILVFHAARHHMLSKEVSWFRLPAVLAVAALLTGVFYCLTPLSGHRQVVMSMAVFVGVTLVAVQVWSVTQLLREAGTDDLFNFYIQLVERRDAKAHGGIVESYRHLREHGNSFLIVVFELLLAAVLFAVSLSTGHDAVIYLFVATFLWVVPAAGIWLVGTRLEKQFVVDTPVPTSGSPSAPLHQ